MNIAHTDNNGLVTDYQIECDRRIFGGLANNWGYSQAYCVYDMDEALFSDTFSTQAVVSLQLESYGSTYMSNEETVTLQQGVTFLFT